MFTRRAFLERSGFGIGGIALTWLLQEEAARAAEHASTVKRIAQDLKPRPTHYPPSARAMVHFMQNGGPSQMDLFDPKPELQKRAGQPIPRSVELYQMGNSDKILGSPFKFLKCGQCGMELADVMLHLGSIADDICLVRSVYTEHNNH